MIIFTICLLFVCLGNIHSQINVPNPSIDLHLDIENVEYEFVEKRKADLQRDVEGWEDRFGNSDRAVKFFRQGSSLRLSNYNINVVHTVSFWACITDPSEIPSGAIPFKPTDTQMEFYNWTDRENRILKGLGRKKATVGFNRYIPKPDGTIVPWYLWAYKPAQFDQRGWYHIFVVHGMYYTRLVMYKPDLTKAYSYIWMGDQGFPTNKYLYLGGYGEHFPANSAMDDFKVYDAALSKEQVSALYHSESQLSMGNEALLNVGTGAPLYSSTWYFHCVGLDETFRYVMQNQTDLSFLSAEAGYALAKVSKAESDYQQWAFSPVSDTAQGRIFTISNCSTGMNLTDTRESVLQQVSDNTDFQKWCVSQTDANNQTREKGK